MACRKGADGSMRGNNSLADSEQQICLAVVNAGKRARTGELTLCITSMNLFEMHGFSEIYYCQPQYAFRFMLPKV